MADIPGLKTDYTAAVTAGDKFFFGPECPKPGHGQVRYVNGRFCLACAKEKAQRRRVREQSSRTDTGGFNHRVFVLKKTLLQPDNRLEMKNS
ncbi:hypothetical protein [Martelella alba]|uniref:Uncharacterized protein n=1 Tax=Martelella alba TaxID=2590451 RepID=A0ABY2SE39_9HYPH|nr:hypothetical protein [Martelella alba]TKI02956.1 hypothetical protein FCN80_23385 [Martelella alba]